VGKDPRENDDDFGFWSLIVFWLLVVFIVGLTDAFGLALGIIGRPVGTVWLLLGTVISLGDIFWLLVVGGLIALRLWLVLPHCFSISALLCDLELSSGCLLESLLY